MGKINKRSYFFCVVLGIYKNSLIINFLGLLKVVKECFEVVLLILEYGLNIFLENEKECGSES